MSVKIFDRPDVQDFLKVLSGLDKDGGSPRVKQIVHRIMSDLFKAIDDLDITPDEYWMGVAWLNDLGAAGQAGLVSPGLGVDHFIDEADRKDLVRRRRRQSRLSHWQVVSANGGHSRSTTGQALL